MISHGENLSEKLFDEPRMQFQNKMDCRAKVVRPGTNYNYGNTLLPCIYIHFIQNRPLTASSLVYVPILLYLFLLSLCAPLVTVKI